MKQLTLECIRNSNRNPPEDLTAIIEGLQMASLALSNDVAQWTAVPVKFTFLTCTHLQQGAVHTSTSNTAEISNLFIEANTGISIQVRLNQNFIRMLCEIAFGGEAKELLDQENRPISGIERGVADIFSKIVTQSVAQSFSFPASSYFSLEAPFAGDHKSGREIPKPRMTAKISAQIASHEMHFNIDLTENFLSRAVAMASEHKALTDNPDKTGQGSMAAGLEPVQIGLTAILTEMPIKLAVLSNLHVGQIINLNVSLKSEVMVLSGGVSLFKTHLGQHDGNYCLVIDEQIFST